MYGCVIKHYINLTFIISAVSEASWPWVVPWSYSSNCGPKYTHVDRNWGLCPWVTHGHLLGPVARGTHMDRRQPWALLTPRLKALVQRHKPSPATCTFALQITFFLQSIYKLLTRTQMYYVKYYVPKRFNFSNQPPKHDFDKSIKPIISQWNFCRNI